MFEIVRCEYSDQEELPGEDAFVVIDNLCGRMASGAAVGCRRPIRQRAARRVAVL